MWTTKDAVALATCMKWVNEDLGALEAKMRLLFTGDKWTAQKASPGLLLSQWNVIGVEQASDPLAALKPNADSLTLMNDLKRLKERK
jgi:hypothetical protein